MPLRVMTYNILNGGVGREQYIREVIRAVAPQVVILQEVADSSWLERLANALQMQWFLGNEAKNSRVAMLSRLPVVSFASHHSFPIWHNVIEAEVLYQTNQSLILFGVHLIPHLWFGFEVWRYWEVSRVLARSQKFPGTPLLVAGDFNAIAPGDGVGIKASPASIQAMLFFQGNHIFQFALQRLLSADFIDTYRFLHPQEKEHTYPTFSPSTRFDYIFVNPTLQRYLKDCWVVREPQSVSEASDHFPVVAEFDLNT